MTTLNIEAWRWAQAAGAGVRMPGGCRLLYWALAMAAGTNARCDHDVELPPELERLSRRTLESYYVRLQRHGLIARDAAGVTLLGWRGAGLAS